MPWWIPLVLLPLALLFRIRRNVDSWPDAAIWFVVSCIGIGFLILLIGALPALPDLYCLIAAAVLLPPVAFGIYASKRRPRGSRRLGKADQRWSRGVCGKCQYDLRGITSRKCPECGTDVPRGYWNAMNCQAGATELAKSAQRDAAQTDSEEIPPP